MDSLDGSFPAGVSSGGEKVFVAGMYVSTYRVSRWSQARTGEEEPY